MDWLLFQNLKPQKLILRAFSDLIVISTHENYLPYGISCIHVDQYPSHDVVDSSRQSHLAESFSHLLKEMWNEGDVAVVKALRLFKVPIA